MNGKELKELRKKLKITQSDLANKVGVSMRTVQNWEGDINAIPRAVELHLNEYTDISHFQNNESELNNTQQKYQIVENIEDIPEQFRNWVKPFYPDMRVGAGLELGNYHGPTKYFILVPFSDKVQFWAQVEGKSMLPRYNNNDLVGLTEIHYDGVFPGHNYVVALKSGSAHLKRVEFIKDKPDTLNLVSLNPEYDPKEFYIDKIDKFFKVKMFISNDE
ncbi:S24 family peptidase [Elizabethkingia meningoseptica]|uniref:S24 family peptidase n=1 Tax=Elizabethkingia meningoseptica TaxID=238 RepID=UPI003892A01E